MSAINPTKTILKNNTYKHYDLLHNENLSNIRLTLDYPEDHNLLSLIAENLYPTKKLFGLDDIIKFIKKNPSILDINLKYVKTNYLT